MSQPAPRLKKLPLLITVDGEAKTAKTTGSRVISDALKNVEMKVYDADAGAFFRRMTICALEYLGYRDLDADIPEVSESELRHSLIEIIKNDAAFAERDWHLESKLVERYVSIIGNMTEAQDAKDGWYDKIVAKASDGSYDAMVINARNPRDHLTKWGTPLFDLLVYCEPKESARRILLARGNTSPTSDELDKQTADVEKRRYLDRHRDKYFYVDPKNIIDFVGDDPALAEAIIQKSWQPESVSMPDESPATIRVDTTNISLDQTKAIISALAVSAVNFAQSHSVR